MEPRLYEIICPKCNKAGFRNNENGKPACKQCGYVLTTDDMDNIMNEASERLKKKVEILVWGDPTKEFERLGIKATCTWQGESNSGSDMRVYEMTYYAFEDLCKDAEDDSNENWQDCAWRSAEGSNMGSVGPRYNINHHYICAWDGGHREDIIEDNKKEKPGDRYCPERQYKNLLEYFCDEVGAGQPRNVCALAVDLARQNGIKMAELFRKYQG